MLLEYAQVVRMLGGGRAQLHCFDGVTRQGLIRGTMRRRVWINTVCYLYYYYFNYYYLFIFTHLLF